MLDSELLEEYDATLAAVRTHRAAVKAEPLMTSKRGRPVLNPHYALLRDRELHLTRLVRLMIARKLTNERSFEEEAAGVLDGE